MGRLVDLSHPIEHGMVTYPGLPGPVISDFLGREASRGHYSEGTTFHIARIRMVANTGTSRAIASSTTLGRPSRRLDRAKTSSASWSPRGSPT